MNKTFVGILAVWTFSAWTIVGDNQARIDKVYLQSKSPKSRLIPRILLLLPPLIFVKTIPLKYVKKRFFLLLLLLVKVWHTYYLN